MFLWEFDNILQYFLRQTNIDALPELHLYPVKKHPGSCQAISPWWKNIIDLKPFRNPSAIYIKSWLLRTSDIIVPHGRQVALRAFLWSIHRHVLWSFFPTKTVRFQLNEDLMSSCGKLRMSNYTITMSSLFQLHKTKASCLGYNWHGPFRGVKSDLLCMHTCPVFRFKCRCQGWRWHFVSLHTSQLFYVKPSDER